MQAVPRPSLRVLLRQEVEELARLQVALRLRHKYPEHFLNVLELQGNRAAVYDYELDEANEASDVVFVRDRAVD